METQYGQGTEQVLTLTNYGIDEDTKEEIKTRVTIAPAMIQVVVVSDEPVQKAFGREQHKVNVLLVDDNRIELFLTYGDVIKLERAAGYYLLP